MALKLKLREMGEFERIAGMPWMRASKLMQVRRCRPHRLELEGCGECRVEAPRPCQPHQQAVAECEACEMPTAPIEVWAAVGWLLRRRVAPGVTYEEYIDEADFDDLMTALAAEGNGEGDSATAS